MLKYTEEEIIIILINYYEKYQNNSGGYYKKNAKALDLPSIGTIEKMFGCWTNALKKANIPTYYDNLHKIYKKICKQCKTEFEVDCQNKEQIFCDHSCSATYNNATRSNDYKEKQIKSLKKNFKHENIN